MPEFHVGDKVYKKHELAIEWAFFQALHQGRAIALDVVCLNREDAVAFGGEDAGKVYDEDPDASVHARFLIRVDPIGSVS